jgi:hypothetical protein
MNKIFTAIFSLLFSLNSYAQEEYPADSISYQDSILLRNFWTNFKEAIKKNDKDKLSGLCAFPFYCTPCVADTTLKKNDHVTIKVTSTVFFESQYREFFDGPIKDKVEKDKNFDLDLFYPSFNEKKKRTGFIISYTIVPPSKKGEGLQGFIYIRKIAGKFKITGIDTVP